MGYQVTSFQSAAECGRSGLDMTQHARKRVQQRGVNRDVLDCLLAYGHHEPDHKGCEIVTFDAKAMDDLARYERRALKTKASDCAHLYAVVDSDGVIVTAGHRFRRIPRDLSLSSYRSGRSRRPKVLHSKSIGFAH